jgi:ATP-dependent RNA helicase DDX18/HAS1
VKA